ncbi:MAG: ankyrin repeat domain-containing protein [Amoebophilaceae bacterium]|nr:ankyrin repeat domain-containing protein [Amoebophilaceae bacterium]
MKIKNLPKRLLRLYFLLLIGGCSQGHSLEMNQSPKKSLSHALDRWKALRSSNPLLASFILHVENNNFNKIQQSVERGLDWHLTPIDALGTTAIAFAVQRGHTAIVELFLKDPETNLQQICDEEGNGLLMTALINGHTDVAVLLLKEQDININQSNKRNQNPLGIAISKNKIEIVEMLLAKKVIITRPLEMLWLCGMHKNMEIASLLLNNIKNKSELLNEPFRKVSLLEFAIHNAAIEFAKLLRSHGANINTLSDNGATLLMIAADNGSLDIVEWLLSTEEIDINAQNMNGLTALITAAEQGHQPIVTLLLQKGADPNFIAGAGLPTKTALMVAAGSGHTAIVDTLIKSPKTAIGYINRHGKNALYFAIKFWKPDIIEMLLNDTAVDLFEGTNCYLLLTELFIRYYETKLNSDKLLIQKICNRLTKTTLLMEDLIIDLIKTACDDKHFFIKSIDFYIKQKKASQKGVCIAGALIKGSFVPEASIDLYKIKPYGRTLLSYAAEYGNQTLCMMLLPHTLQKDIDSKDPNGRTPLYYAAIMGHFLIFNQLIQLIEEKAGSLAKELNHHSILAHVLTELTTNPNHIGSQCIVQKLLNSKGQIAVADLTSTQYLALLDFVLSRKNQELLPKLNLHTRLIDHIKDETHILTLLSKLSDATKQASFNKVDTAGRTLVSHAAATGSLAVVTALLVAADTINQADKMGKTPLFYAIEAGHPAAVELLLKKGAQVNHRDKKDGSPLLYAIKSKKYHVEIMHQLLAQGADFTHCDPSGHGALWYAVDKNYTAVVDLLLPKMETEPRCHTEICIAIPLAQDRNYTAIYDRLVEVIAPVLEQDHEGWVAYKKLPKWNTKPIIYSTHAQNRAQERGITYQAIEEIINNPNAQKRTSKRSKDILQLVVNDLCVVVAIDKNKTVVLTSYFTNTCS